LSLMEFASCQKIDKFKNLTWWNNFSAKVNLFDYYTPVYIQDVLHRNDTLGAYDTYEEYCKDSDYIKDDLCTKGKNRKLNISEFSEYSEGCLSKDGKLFLVVSAGEYMGVGNHVFRYWVKENYLEEAKRLNEIFDMTKVGFATPGKFYGAWFASPKQFGKKNGNVFIMTGSEGDVGCGSTFTYEFDFAKNEIKAVKQCGSCDDRKETCEAIE